MNPEEDPYVGKRSKKYKSKADKEKALGRKYEIPILRQSHSTLGSLNMDFVEEPWKDPIRFEYDITMLERDMLALCELTSVIDKSTVLEDTPSCFLGSGQVSYKYSWHPGVPSSYIRLKCNQPKRPKTAGCPQNDCEERDVLQRTESECILYLAGLGKPHKSGIFLTVPAVTRDAGTLVDMKEPSDCSSNEVYCPNTALMSHSAALDNGIGQTKSIEANEEINYGSGGGISWLKQVVSSIAGSSPTPHQEDQQGSFESAAETTDQVYCVWNKRPGGIDFPMESNAETIPSSQVPTRAHQSRHSTAVVSFSENVNAEGYQRTLELNNPVVFPTLSEAASMAPAATEVPPHPNAGHEQDFCVSAHNADFSVASNSHRYIRIPDLQVSPAQRWIASTQFFSQNNETRPISLAKAISRSRGLKSCKKLQIAGKNPHILQYICGAPTARPRKVDSSHQVGPLDFVDSSTRIGPHRCIESAMKIDFSNMV